MTDAVGERGATARGTAAPGGAGFGPILESSLDAVIEIDGDGIVTRWNAAAETVFGYPRERAIGAELILLIVPEAMRERHRAGLAHAARTGEGPLLNQRVEVPALRADGTEIPIELALAAIPPQAPGGTWSFCAFARDLSERARAQEALRASEARFARLVENVPGMVYEFALSPGGEMGFRYASSASKTILGVEPETMGMEGIGRSLPAEEREEFLASILASARDLAPWRWRGEMTTASGETIWAEANSRPTREPDGTVVWHGILLDGTEAHRIVAENDESRLFLEAIVGSLPDIVFIKDGDTLNYTMLNRAGEGFFGLPIGGALGRSDFELFGPVAAMRMVAEDEDLLEQGHLFANEVVHRNAAGEAVHLRTRRGRITDPVRGKNYILGISSDVTEFRRLEEHLCLVNESLEETVLLRTAELKATQEEILSRLGRAAAYRDGETGSHILRMARTCEIVGRELGLPESDCALLLAAAPMHDIGKIAIPDGILLKPGRLDESEMSVMRGHATIGAQMLAGGTSDLMVGAEVIARTHHERWDGAGYPRGLGGEEIPLAGRIAAIADVFDALTSERPYKRAWSLEATVAEIERSAGTHFDPEVVAAFVRALPAIVASEVGAWGGEGGEDAAGLERAA